MLAAAPPLEAHPARPWKRAGAWLTFLGPFFFASYGFANWVASRRADVAVIVFDWEPHIPFYHVERQGRLMVRMVASELLGRRLEPSPEEIIRTVGNPPKRTGQ